MQKPARCRLKELLDSPEARDLGVRIVEDPSYDPPLHRVFVDVPAAPAAASHPASATVALGDDHGAIVERIRRSVLKALSDGSLHQGNGILGTLGKDRTVQMASVAVTGKATFAEAVRSLLPGWGVVVIPDPSRPQNPNWQLARRAPAAASTATNTSAPVAASTATNTGAPAAAASVLSPNAARVAALSRAIPDKQVVYVGAECLCSSNCTSARPSALANTVSGYGDEADRRTWVALDCEGDLRHVHAVHLLQVQVAEKLWLLH